MPNNDLISRAAAKKIVSLMVCAPTIKIAAEHKIDELPAVDAAPVRHGHWVEETDRENHWHCSECGVVVGVVAKYAPYCYKCGAHMMEVK